MMTWTAISLIGIGHLYCGYLFAIWCLPREIATGKTLRLHNGVAVGFLLVWIVGVTLLLITQGLNITNVQAYFLGGCALSTFLFCRGYFAATEPKTSWDQCINKQCQVALVIYSRHGWPTGSQDALQQLASEKRLHFDGGDYDLLLQTKDDFTRSVTDKYAPTLPSGEIDYNQACAREIALLARAIFGSEQCEGLMTQVANETDASKLDRVAMDALQWLGNAVEKQWGIHNLI